MIRNLSRRYRVSKLERDDIDITMNSNFHIPSSLVLLVQEANYPALSLKGLTCNRKDKGSLYDCEETKTILAYFRKRYIFYETLW